MPSPKNLDLLTSSSSPPLASNYQECIRRRGLEKEELDPELELEEDPERLQAELEKKLAQE